MDFLRALFSDSDRILIRPIETWTENGKRKSRVVHKRVKYVRAKPVLLKLALRELDGIGEQEHANIFFGVCPRFGGDGKYDLAWQIRTIRCLWTDIDHISVEAAIERCTEANVPRPSIVVNSGHGVHLYWLLDEPFLIDDAGAPRPVHTEWTTIDGKRKARKFIVDENGQRIELGYKVKGPPLSPKAQKIQDILQGLAAKVGGDATHDLSRILRIPGTLNRKDQRNGREPVPSSLVELEPDRRYSLDEFEGFAAQSPDRKRRQSLGAVQLPTTKKLSAKNRDKLAELAAICNLAEPGQRSERDFELCAFAIRNGINRIDVEAIVADVGKFAEGGDRYLSMTWAAAEEDVRSQILKKLQDKVAGSKPSSNGHATTLTLTKPSSSSDEAEEDEHGRVIEIRPSSQTVAEVVRAITDRFTKTQSCYRRADQAVIVHGEKIAPVLSAKELSGILNQHVEFVLCSGDSATYTPLPPSIGNVWLHNPAEQSRLPEIRIFSRNPLYTADWRLSKPGFDVDSGIYYAGPSVHPRDNTEHLDRLLNEFCWRAPADRTNYIGMLLTAVLVSKFIGNKPAALFSGNQPGLGKSVLAQIIAILRDGSPVETASYQKNDEEFEKRIGSVVRNGSTTIIVDNAKGSGGKNAGIHSACLERSITDAVLSFRLLGFSSSIRCENSHIFCITANTPEISRDLAMRSIVINLFFNGDPSKREFQIPDPEGYAQQFRNEILGELIGMIERWKASGMPQASKDSRFNKKGWANIIGGILEVSGEPDFLENARESNDDLDPVRGDVAELVYQMAKSQRGVWTPMEIVGLAMANSLLKDEIGDGSDRSKATKLGIILSRYASENVDECERFIFDDGRAASVVWSTDRTGKKYRVNIDEDAEP